MNTFEGKPVRNIQELERLMEEAGWDADQKAEGRRLFHVRGVSKVRPTMHATSVTVQILNTSADAVEEWLTRHPHYRDRVEATVVTGNQLALRKKGWADVNLFAVLLEIENRLFDIHHEWIRRGRP